MLNYFASALIRSSPVPIEQFRPDAQASRTSASHRQPSSRSPTAATKPTLPRADRYALDLRAPHQPAPALRVPPGTLTTSPIPPGCACLIKFFCTCHACLSASGFPFRPWPNKNRSVQAACQGDILIKRINKTEDGDNKLASFHSKNKNVVLTENSSNAFHSISPLCLIILCEAYRAADGSTGSDQCKSPKVHRYHIARC